MRDRNQKVTSIRSGTDERTTARDFEEHLSSMESILRAFDGSQAADEHTARYLLREALQNTPIVLEPLSESLKDRLSELRKALAVFDQKYHGKSVTQILDEDPELAEYLREQGFSPDDA